MYANFERLCAEKGVTPYRVGKETGISTSTLSEWKTGKYTPKDDKLRKIADYFGVTVDYLMTGSDPDGYYENDETARIAQKLHDNPQLRVLFSAAEDASPEALQDAYEMLLILKRRERGE